MILPILAGSLNSLKQLSQDKIISPDGVSALINVYKTFNNDYDVQLIFSQAEQRLKVNDKILCAKLRITRLQP